MNKSFIAALLLSAGFAGQASAVVIDFESLGQTGDSAVSVGSVYVEDGFALSNFGINEFSVWGASSPFSTGSTALMNDNDNGETTLVGIGNQAFNLYSIDLATMYPGYTEDGVDVTINGVKTNGSLVTQTFHVTDGLPQTFSFSGFTNLAYVGWTNGAMYHQFDNINVAAVPEPEGYAMFLAGLGMLGFMLRRRAA